MHEGIQKSLNSKQRKNNIFWDIKYFIKMSKSEFQKTIRIQNQIWNLVVLQWD